MERAPWTDERLDDLARRMDPGFERVDAAIRELRGEIRGLRALMLQLGGTMIAGFAGVITTVLAAG